MSNLTRLEKNNQDLEDLKDQIDALPTMNPIYEYIDSAVSIRNDRQITSNSSAAICDKYKIFVQFSSSKFNFYKINDDNTITLLGSSNTISYSPITYDISQTLLDDEKLTVWASSRTGGSLYSIYTMYYLTFNIKNYEISTPISGGGGTSVAPCNFTINPVNPNIVATTSSNEVNDTSYLAYYFKDGRIVGFGNNATRNFGSREAEWSSDGRYLLYYMGRNGNKPNGTKYLSVCDPVNYTLVAANKNPIGNVVCAYNEENYITNEAFVKYSTNDISREITESAINNASYLWTWKNVLFAINNGNIYVYKINIDLSLTEVTILTNTGSYSSSGLTRPLSNRSAWFKFNNILYCCEVTEADETITKVNIDGNNYSLIYSILDNTQPNNVLTGKSFLTNGRIKIWNNAK